VCTQLLGSGWRRNIDPTWPDINITCQDDILASQLIYTIYVVVKQVSM